MQEFEQYRNRIEECLKSGTTQEQHACITAVYDQVMLRMRELSTDLVKLMNPTTANAFTEAQDAWSDYHLKEGEFAFLFDGMGMSGRVMQAYAIAALAIDRAEWLYKLWEDNPHSA